MSSLRIKKSTKPSARWQKWQAITTLDDRDAAFDEEIESLERLVADLKRIRFSDFPTSSDIEKMPVINHWEMSRTMVPCLVGTVRKHAVGRPGVEVTSELIVFAFDKGFARTLSGFYALGPEIDDPLTEEKLPK
ncbi:hypothetical protein LJR231_001773 [Phyllobacterium sp. LjRoot231]|uniref:hypothetical protein n=1 Tax=Phyllobacterium sp. LjRoot231 TaxID=3342289 RepID=UPI003ECF1E34